LMLKRMFDFFRKKKSPAIILPVSSEVAEELERSQEALKLHEMFRKEASVRKSRSERTAEYHARLDMHRDEYARLVEERHLRPPPGTVEIDRNGEAVEAAFVLCASDREAVSLYALVIDIENAHPEYMVGDVIERVVKPILFPRLPSWSVKVVG
jgi:hypothetical protein